MTVEAANSFPQMRGVGEPPVESSTFLSSDEESQSHQSNQTTILGRLKVPLVVLALVACLAATMGFFHQHSPQITKDANGVESKVGWYEDSHSRGGPYHGTYNDGHLQFGSLCVGVDPGQVHNNGARVQLRPCTDGSNIQWKFSSLAQEDKLRLVAAPEKCLDVVNHAFQNGTPLQIWDCIHGNYDQKLVKTQDSMGSFNHPSSPMRLQWANTGQGTFYVDVKDGSQHLWNQVQIWNYGPNQLFKA